MPLKPTPCHRDLASRHELTSFDLDRELSILPRSFEVLRKSINIASPAFRFSDLPSLPCIIDFSGLTDFTGFNDFTDFTGFSRFSYFTDLSTEALAQVDFSKTEFLPIITM